MNLIDLSIPIDSNTPVYPGDPISVFDHISRIEKDGWNEHRLTFNTHFGTHIDSPWHMISNGKRISDFHLTKFCGRGIVIDVRGMEEIDVNIDCVSPDDIVLFWTDHILNAKSADFFQCAPVILPCLAEKLIEKKVKLIGIDSYKPRCFSFSCA